MGAAGAAEVYRWAAEPATTRSGLLDAQNNALTSGLVAETAVYEFLDDRAEVRRSVAGLPVDSGIEPAYLTRFRHEGVEALCIVARSRQLVRYAG